MTKNKTRGWCFTINNFTLSDVASCMSAYEDDENTSYLIIGVEKAPRTGTKHIQGYIYYTNPVSFKYVKGWLPAGAHIEPQQAKANVSAYCYCMEDGDYYEMGSRPRQGHRTDLEVIKNDLLEGVPMNKVSLQYFSQWCQYRKAFNEFQRMHSKYDTVMISFDETDEFDVQNVMHEYNKDTDLLIQDMLYPLQIMMHYFSKSYRLIFVPSFCNSHTLDKYILYTIGKYVETGIQAKA